MKMSKQIRSLVLAAGIAAAASMAQGQPGTSFTYQGQLKNNGTLVDSLIMADFSLFDAGAGGSQIGSTISQPITPDMGIFSTDLDFGVSAYTANQALWLEISVDGELLGRQKLSATPFAMNTRGINVSSSGRVGIGTSSQQDIFHVTGNNARILTESTSGSFSGIRSRLGTYEYFTGTDSNGVAEPIWHVFDNRTGQRRLALEPSGNFGIGVSNPVTRLQVAGTGSFSGNVGIGTTTPNRLLTVQDLSANAFIGMVSATQTGILFGTSAGATNGGVLYNADVADGLSFRTATNTPRMVINNAGRVGIGTSAPADVLHIAGNNARIFTEATSGNFSGIRSRLAGQEFFTGVDNFSGGTPLWHVFDNTAGQRRMAILSNGNVGIGTSFPGVALDVVGKVRTDDEILVYSSSGINVILGESAANRGKVSVFDENSVARSVIAFDAAGLGFMQTDNYFTNSDRRLKTEIHELSDALETIGALRGVTYQWKEKAEAGDQIGFIAQEVELVLPELVSTNEETGYKSVAYANVTAVLVEAMHDQQDQIELMQAEIDSLKSGGVPVAGASYAMPMLIGGAAFGGLALIRRRTK